MSKIEVITSVAEMRVQIQRIIKEANECLYIISPYIKFDNEMKILLKSMGDSDGVNICFVYRKNQEKKNLAEIKASLDEMPHIPKCFVKDLHAKCYLNEKMALVTSLNLYNYSMMDNVEMGIFVDTDKGFFGPGASEILYKNIREKAEGIIKLSEPADSPAASEVAVQGRKMPSKKRVASKETPQVSTVPAKGHCIRCDEEIVANPGRPFCDKDFRSWNRYKKEGYPENHCHLCGKEWETTRATPVCRSCYQQHKKYVDAALASS